VKDGIKRLTARETNLADDHSLHFFIKINTPADVVDDDDRIFDRDEQYNNVSELLMNIFPYGATSFVISCLQMKFATNRKFTSFSVKPGAYLFRTIFLTSVNTRRRIDFYEKVQAMIVC
jgi:hypothetical protein